MAGHEAVVVPRKQLQHSLHFGGVADPDGIELLRSVATRHRRNLDRSGRLRLVAWSRTPARQRPGGVVSGSPNGPPTGELGHLVDTTRPCPSRIGTGHQVVGTLPRLLLDEDHQRFGQNAIVLHGLGSSL